MKNPEEIKKLADGRLEEAQILCNAGKYDAAFYLAGYSIELMLKAKLDADITNGNRELAEIYGYLFSGTGKNESCLWSEQIRYQPIGLKKENVVKRFIELLTGDRGLLKWIELN